MVARDRLEKSQTYSEKDKKYMSGNTPFIAVIGAGRVGAEAAERAVNDYGLPVVLHSYKPDKAKANARDIKAGLQPGRDADLLQATGSFEDIRGAAVIIYAAGKAAGAVGAQSREELIASNAALIWQDFQEISHVAPNAKVIMITNPDVTMARVAWQASGMPAENFMSMGVGLDTIRYRSFLAEELGVSIEDVAGYALGDHTEHGILPITSTTTVSIDGRAHTLQELVDAGHITTEKIAEIVKKTKIEGFEIVKALDGAGASRAPAQVAVSLADSIIRDEQVVSVVGVWHNADSPWLEGLHMHHGIFLGTPAKLGASGVEGILPPHMTEEEFVALQDIASQSSALQSGAMALNLIRFYKHHGLRAEHKNSEIVLGFDESQASALEDSAKQKILTDLARYLLDSEGRLRTESRERVNIEDSSVSIPMLPTAFVTLYTEGLMETERGIRELPPIEGDQERRL